MIFEMCVLKWIPAFAGMTGNACWNDEQAKTLAGVAKETLVDTAGNDCWNGSKQNLRHTCERRYPLQ